jgi:hypothetical protein
VSVFLELCVVRSRVFVMRTADEIFREAFSVPRGLRSAEYKRGVLAALKFRLEGVKISDPFPEGTAAADAFYSGVDEGHRLWRSENEHATESHQAA